MKLRSQHISALSVTMLTLGLAAGAIAPFVTSPPATAVSPANTSFSDTQNSWAQSFIHNLAERHIVTGYPDNTFRPEQPVDRDEFAAILRQAFSQPVERKIASGSVYKDVPQGYWAASAIEEAYEMGFMKGYPGGEFRPNQSVSRVEVLVSLAQNLNLPTTTSAVDKPVAVVTTSAPMQSVPRRRAERPLMVNYPDRRMLNPTRPATRGEVAAFIHQALVSQGKAAPIADQSADQYVVSR